jgi:hypothetical protein
VNGRFWPEQGIGAVRTDIANVQKDGLDPQLFDALLICAVGIMPPTDAFLDSGQCPLGVACPFEYAASMVAPDVTAVSWQVMAELILAQFRMTGSYKLLSDLATFYRGTTVIQLFPSISAAALQRPGNGLVARYGAEAGVVWDAFSTFRDRVLRKAILEVLPNSRVLPAPSEALQSPGFLQASFERSNDHWHANDLHGELVIRQFEAIVVRTADGELPRDADPKT